MEDWANYLRNCTFVFTRTIGFECFKFYLLFNFYNFPCSHLKEAKIKSWLTETRCVKFWLI